jgi:integrase
MRVFKSTYRDRNGKKQKTLKWYVEFKDHLEITRRLPAYTGKNESEGLGRWLEKLSASRKNNEQPDVQLGQWLQGLPDRILAKLIGLGLVDGQRIEVAKPLAIHIADYASVLEAKGRPRDYVVRTRNRLNKIIQTCRFFYFRDITRSKVEIYSGRLRDEYGGTTRKHYLDTLTAFVHWAEQDGRIITNPLTKIHKPKRDSKLKGVLTEQQFHSLLTITARKNVIIGGSTGPERSVLYLLAGITGLRRKELLGLTWANIHLLNDSPYVTVPAKLAKNSKQADQPITSATFAILQAYKAEQKPDDADRVFACLSRHINTAELLRQDLKAANLPLKDQDGNEICFHSLRNSYISFLANSKAPAKVIQKLARHSDPRLTFNLYARTFKKTEQEAIKHLPDMTDFAGQFVLSGCLAHPGARDSLPVPSEEKKNAISHTATAFSTQKSLPPRGVEPLSPG